MGKTFHLEKYDCFENILYYSLLLTTTTLGVSKMIIDRLNNWWIDIHRRGMEEREGWRKIKGM